MGNLTLDPFWISFMPVYQHSIGATTFILTVIVLYLMMYKTPEYGKPLARYVMLTQITILVADSGWGFVLCPIPLLPLVAFLCEGFACGTPNGVQIGTVLMYQFVNQSALAIACTFHYKYTTIVRMKYGQEVSNTNKNLMRLFFWVVLELPVIGVVTAGVCQQELHEFLLAECLTIIICCCAFFILQTLRLLSDKTSTMSDRTRKLQRGLTITLVVQMITPFAIQAVPVFMFIVSMVNTWFTPGTMCFILCVFLCHASFHTILLIWTTPSYRAAITCSSRQRKMTLFSPSGAAVTQA